TSTLEVSPSAIEFEASANNTQNITITASGAWTATTEGSGFTISPASGTGNATIVATATAATGATGKIIVALTETALTKEIAVSQKTSGGEPTVIFSEDFNTINGKGGNDGKWNGTDASGDKLETFENWSLTEGYQGSKSIKLGAGSKQGSAQTPELTNLAGDAILTFRAGAWDSGSEQTELLLEIEGGSLDQTAVTLEKGKFNDYTVNISGGMATTKITFKGKQAKNSRFFLDDVVVKSK
ncbi:MAG TPA: hypothetical protein DDW85_04145, partial [Porphyromonadaceae bacterium]|nr:hypothetical protein [Porphyromonadaceae bacterium]